MLKRLAPGLRAVMLADLLLAASPVRAQMPPNMAVAVTTVAPEDVPITNELPGRKQRVTVQAKDSRRMQTAGLLKLNVRSVQGGMAPLPAFSRIEWVKGPAQVVGYNEYTGGR